jgi:hypothetical protein
MKENIALYVGVFAGAVYRGCCKTSVLQQQPLKNVFSQGFSLRKYKACAKVTDFCNRLYKQGADIKPLRMNNKKEKQA